MWVRLCTDHSIYVINFKPHNLLKPLLTEIMRPRNIRQPVLNLHMASSQVKEPQTETHLGSTNIVINSNKRIVQLGGKRVTESQNGPHSPVNLQAVRLGNPMGGGGICNSQSPAGGNSQAQPGKQGFCKYSWLP